jgi:hypothetical protein
MAFGQINPLNIVVAQRLAANQNVDASTATRHALVGTLLGEGILGPIIARQLAIRDAAAVSAPVAVGVTTTPAQAATPLDTIVNNLQAWTQAQKNRDDEDLKRAEELKAEAERRRKERTEALKALCDSLGALSGGGAAQAASEKGASPGPKRQPS